MFNSYEIYYDMTRKRYDCEKCYCYFHFISV